ncbi:RIP metalloprotease RseP [Rhodospirillum rubrum]|uniref:Zinc metalloprotease n=1 Tax=Rhodospirillum rubrum (strain ATCC 11170 / ATH 1.1.1 / DSM 467 / LMG 4362 / NCIMB 8255 / S1) TaxID=269796 RepID=Q2RU02_RHORT|nr:RIP metalloprotease RseP [Rhodospirillum rubrum]ABC22393.1 RseP peptidase. Metallo peptidase. MEROPS family M50B [Rhodospirillum rubrum ATCC 11170]AEO48110.1 peptidase RseP [Rhodospirillum rubrum F11]MBK5953974.1 RIP metalloprotease RseP [Rhodospirillum rubrum]QXG82029.1 RIP metalloprotease RseP [Rhodospirillum rubrum]HAP99830.1 RIP metalloprotease RseP [Rhodospirillum rubrum]
MLDLLHTVLSFLVVLTAVVFVHEFGHFLVARLNGVRVEVFSIGFGRELFGFNDRYGTRWRLSLLPLGGYVRFFGDADETSGTAETTRPLSKAEEAVSFHHKRVGQRFAIVLAGPMANFLFSIVVFAGLYMTIGQPHSAPVVGEVIAGSAAAEAGLLAGDRIVAIDGTPIDRFQDVRRVVPLSNGAPLHIDILRDNAPLAVIALPRMVETDDGLGNKVQVAQLGVKVSLSQADVQRLGPLDALGQAVGQTWQLSADTLTYLGQVVRGNRSAEELGGPVRIAQFSGKAAERGVLDLVTFIALLSVNLGLINLFPIPMLDGGHLMFYTIEALRGRPLGARAQEYGLRFGLALVLAMMVFATWNDLSLINW